MIEFAEFAAAMRWMESLVGKPATEEQSEAYFDCLRDLEPGVLIVAVRRVMCEHQYPTLPMPAVIRQAALEATVGQTMAAHEAQALATRAVIRAGGMYASPEDRWAVYASLPPLVAALLRRLGWSTIADCDDPEILRGQWRRAWEEVQTRERKAVALPEELRPKPALGNPIAIPESLFRLPDDADTPKNRLLPCPR